MFWKYGSQTSQWKLLCGFVFGVLFFSYSGVTPQNKNHTIADKNLPENILKYSLPDTNGKIVQFKDFKGKKVYIKFWASWCSICLAGIDELSELAQEKSRDKEFLVITIVSPGYLSEKSKEDFVFWYKKQGYTPKVFFDRDGLLMKEFGIKGYPTSVFIGTDGRLAKIHQGHLNNQEIEKMLKEII